MPKLFFFIGLIVFVGSFIIWFLRQLFTPEELGELTKEETLDFQPTLREKQLHIKDEVSDLKRDLTQLERDADAEKRKAKQNERLKMQSKSQTMLKTNNPLSINYNH